jgi:nucleotide-binding universal stress UspA family protein
MKILLATDGSEYSESAARFLTRLQWTREDSIAVFHAIYAVPFRQDEKFYHSQLAAIKKELAPKILDSTVDMLKPMPAKVSVEIEEGHLNQCAPDQCIIEAAEKTGADLIVMGTRGTKGIGSLFLGSVTRLVAIHSTTPVLAVKPTNPDPTGRMKIIIATDGSDYSRATAAFLTTLPFPDNVNVTVLNAISSGFSDIPERLALEVNERIKDIVADSKTIEFAASRTTIEQTGDILRKRFKNIVLQSMVGDPSMEILRAAETLEADLIAVGSRGLRGIKGLLGSVSRNILTHARCSVLIGERSG